MSLLYNPHSKTEFRFCDSSSINVEHCQRVFDLVLSQLYPCVCSCGTLCTSEIKTRPYILRCPSCLKQKSKLAHTPFRNLRVSQHFIGWLLEECFVRHPKVVTAAEVVHRLGVTERTALLMRRRVQILACEQSEKIRYLIFNQMKKEFKDFTLPPEGTDISQVVARKKVVHADTVVLWSARGRKGRSRFRHSGQTSSIYRSPRLGGAQVGTLVSVMGIQNGWCILDSIPNQKAETIGPLFRRSLPLQTVVFTDEGYKFLYRIYQHRMINHSAKSPDNRFRFARDRWSKNGVHSQVSEGLNSSLKTEMRAFRFFKCPYSSLYLNEWSFFHNLRYFGLPKIAKAKSRCVDGDGWIDSTRYNRRLRHVAGASRERGSAEHGPAQRS